jgi:hypothetical protein
MQLTIMPAVAHNISILFGILFSLCGAIMVFWGLFNLIGCLSIDISQGCWLNGLYILAGIIAFAISIKLRGS